MAQSFSPYNFLSNIVLLRIMKNQHLKKTAIRRLGVCVLLKEEIFVKLNFLTYRKFQKLTF